MSGKSLITLLLSFISLVSLYFITILDESLIFFILVPLAISPIWFAGSKIDPLKGYWFGKTIEELEQEEKALWSEISTWGESKSHAEQQRRKLIFKKHNKVINKINEYNKNIR